MIDIGDVERLLRRMIREELSQIVMGKIISNETPARSTITRQSNETSRENLRSVQPFGLSSRAPTGTPALIVPTAFDHTNLNVVGHFDEKGKSAVEDGEVALYNAYGQLVYLSNGKIQIGSNAASEPLVLGNVLKKLLTDWLTADLAQTHVGNLGYPTGTPVNSPDYQKLLESPVEDSKMLSDVSFTEKG